MIFRKTCLKQYGLDLAWYYSSPGLDRLRYSKAYNKFVEGYDPSKPDMHILYLDANNLYGLAMSQPLPTGGFEWVNIHNINVNDIHKDSDKVYIPEVDFEYPTELHKDHNSYPPAPERLMVNKDWMSEYQHSLMGNVRLANVEKL